MIFLPGCINVLFSNVQSINVFGINNGLMKPVNIALHNKTRPDESQLL